MSRNYKVPNVTKEEVLSLMHYDKERGLIWDVRRGRAHIGGEVGGEERGQIRLGGVRVYTSHIVWFLHHGYWPSSIPLWVDHKDGNISNELIDNLRACSPSQNNTNRSIRSDQKIHKGVTFTQGKFRAGIQYEGRKYFLGSFGTEELAAAAYQGASRVLHGEFSIFNRT